MSLIDNLMKATDSIIINRALFILQFLYSQFYGKEFFLFTNFSVFYKKTRIHIIEDGGINYLQQKLKLYYERSDDI